MGEEFDDFMGSGGAKSFQFDAPGDSITGVVMEAPEKLQQTDIESGELKFWQDGKPKWYFRVKLQTDLRDDADDDGIRTLSLSWHRLNAVRQAVTQAGEKTIKVGGKLFLRFDAFEDKKVAKYKANPAKVGWTARYRAPEVDPEFMGPAETSGGGSLLDQMRADKAAQQETLESVRAKQVEDPPF